MTRRVKRHPFCGGAGTPLARTRLRGLRGLGNTQGPDLCKGDILRVLEMILFNKYTNSIFFKFFLGGSIKLIRPHTEHTIYSGTRLIETRLLEILDYYRQNTRYKKLLQKLLLLLETQHR